MERNETQNIKLVTDFIFYCSNYKTREIINILKYRITRTNMPNKLRFFNFLSFMMGCMQKSSTGVIMHEWAKIKWMNKEHNCVQFYDEVHNFPRLTVIIEVEHNELYLETIPF